MDLEASSARTCAAGRLVGFAVEEACNGSATGKTCCGRILRNILAGSGRLWKRGNFGGVSGAGYRISGGCAGVRPDGGGDGSRARSYFGRPSEPGYFVGIGCGQEVSGFGLDSLRCGASGGRDCGGGGGGR